MWSNYPHVPVRQLQRECVLSLLSFHWTFSLLVEAYWKRSQTDEAVWMLGKYHWIPVQSHLLHVVPDVVCVVALAESFIRQGGYVVILHGETKYHSFFLLGEKTWLFNIVYFLYPWTK